MPPPKLSHSPEGLREVINHHIPYEVRMMRHTFSMLADGQACLWVNQVVVNALIESFCLHARSLIEFFSGQKGPADGMTAAKHFAKEDYQPSSDTGPGKEFQHKLNAQIAHPSYYRTSNDEQKLSAQDRSTLMKFVEDELVRLSAAMKDIYKPHWPSDMTSPALGASVAARIDVRGPVGPTNQIGMISNWGTGPTGPVGPAREETFTYSTDPKPK